MKFTYLDKLPRTIKVRHGKGELQDMITAFAKSDHEVIKIDWHENHYASAVVCASVLHNAVKRSGRSIKAMRRGEDVYLVKKHVLY